MNGKAVLGILLVASLAGNASFLISAFSRSAARAGVFEQLALTAEQAAKFEGAKRAFQGERERAQRRMAELRGVLADEFARQAPDRQRMVTTAVEMAEVQTGMRPRLVDHLLALHALLTPAQRAAFAALMHSGGGSGAVCPGNMLYPAQSEEGAAGR